MDRVRGLDGIRFVCAVFVVLGHVGLTLSFLLDVHWPPLTRALQATWGVLFNGPAAVIVFFVISGMCIHLPSSRGKPVSVFPYYAQRIARIVPPAALAALLYIVLDNRPKSWNDTTLWSIFCEIAYYLLYPALLWLRLRTGWLPLIAVTYVSTLTMAVTHPALLQSALNGYIAFGAWTWVIGLPCWLLGCLLAEQYGRFPLLTRSQMWTLRAALLGVSIVLRTIKFHAVGLIASDVVTLNLFAFPVFVWLGCEIAYAKQHGVLPWLERSGSWSYSLYLIHPLTGVALATLGLRMLVPGVHAFAVVSFVAIFVCSYLYFLVWERPVHRVANLIGKRAVALATQYPSLSVLVGPLPARQPLEPVVQPVAPLDVAAAVVPVDAAASAMAPAAVQSVAPLVPVVPPLDAGAPSMFAQDTTQAPRF